jgi:hypothetical protein
MFPRYRGERRFVLGGLVSGPYAFGASGEWLGVPTPST